MDGRCHVMFVFCSIWHEMGCLDRQCWAISRPTLSLVRLEGVYIFLCNKEKISTLPNWFSTNLWIYVCVCTSEMLWGEERQNLDCFHRIFVLCYFVLPFLIWSKQKKRVELFLCVHLFVYFCSHHQQLSFRLEFTQGWNEGDSNLLNALFVAWRFVVVKICWYEAAKKKKN